MNIAAVRLMCRTISRPGSVTCITREPSVFFSMTSFPHRLHKNQSDEDVENKPVNYFGSKAAVWRARDTWTGGAEDVLWYQPLVISGSLAIFLLYFCCLREENDIDKKLEGNLYDKIEGLEQVQLLLNYRYNKEKGLDVAEIETRLKELGVDTSNL